MLRNLQVIIKFFFYIFFKIYILYSVTYNVHLIFLEEGVKHEFRSETQMLLQIVAKSLYSNKEVRLI